VGAARANGDVEGELAVPDDKLPAAGEIYDKNRYVAWHGASSVYHSGAPSVPMPNGKIVDGKKRKVIVTGVNWMFEHAREARYIVCPSTTYPRTNASLAVSTQHLLLLVARTWMASTTLIPIACSTQRSCKLRMLAGHSTHRQHQYRRLYTHRPTELMGH